MYPVERPVIGRSLFTTNHDWTIKFGLKVLVDYCFTTSFDSIWFGELVYTNCYPPLLSGDVLILME